jgi:hypothetical protein
VTRERDPGAPVEIADIFSLVTVDALDALPIKA